MKKPLLILLLLSLAFEATSADIFGKRKNKKRKKAKTEQVDSSTLAKPAPEAQPRKKKQAEAQSAAPAVTDLTLKLTAEEADSLVAAWYEYCQTVKYDDYFNRIIQAEEVTITGTDEAAWAQKDALYKQRLQDLVSPIPLAYNRQVRDRITGYVEKWPSTTSRIIGLSQLYFPMIEEELLRNDLPIELRALPIIESAMQTGAVSRAAAVGLWQFIASTGKSYGLEINSLV
ncbi:MAG: transglycosylase SLT domain-containing protein, partial [Alistipes sp.]|nr:transglycosylase SLT domain-containing protein [Alistipes sp.]